MSWEFVTSVIGMPFKMRSIWFLTARMRPWYLCGFNIKSYSKMQRRTVLQDSETLSIKMMSLVWLLLYFNVWNATLELELWLAPTCSSSFRQSFLSIFFYFFSFPFVIGRVTDILFQLSCPRRQVQLCNLNLNLNLSMSHQCSIQDVFGFLY